MGERRLRIGLDFDDTLLDTRRAYLGVLNRIHGTDYQADQLTDYSFKILFNCADEHIVDTFTEHFDECHRMGPFPGVIETLTQAGAMGHRFTIITARPEIHMPPLREWVSRHGIKAEKAISAPKPGEKAEQAAREGVDLFVEDNPRHAEMISAKGIRVLLLDRLYNRVCEGPNITRVRDWNEISDILLARGATVPVA